MSDVVRIDRKGRRYRGRPGRKPAGEKSVTSPLVIRVSNEARARLNDLARQNNITLTEFCRQAIEEAAGDCSDVSVFRNVNPRAS